MDHYATATDPVTQESYLLTNRLRHVTDVISSNVSNIDIDNQEEDNYSYDAIGNLVGDVSEGLTVRWNVYGKIAEITKVSGGNQHIGYGYDGSGSRIRKTITSGGNTTHTYYVKDASGNVLGVYEKRNDSIIWKEQHLYGSSRLGIWYPDTAVSEENRLKLNGLIGRRHYELSNHLGNVMAVISDKKVVQADQSFYPEMIDVYDYYAFGGLRDFTKIDSILAGGRGYRYGFNGKENDDEVKGEGNSLDFGARIHDPRLGRFLSLDPLSSKYPGESNYAFVSNNPNIYVDPDGKDRIEYHYKIRKDGKVELRISTEKGVYKSLLHDTFDGSFYFTRHDYKVVTIEDHRSGKALTKSWEEMIYSPSEEIGFGEYMSIKTTGKSGISDMFKLPQIMVLGSGTYDLGWGKADPNRAIYTIDLNDPMIKDLFMLTDLLGAPDLKGANPERVTEMINQGVDILKDNKEQKKTAYCLSCNGIYTTDESGSWRDDRNVKNVKDTIKGHTKKVNETEFKVRNNE